MSIKTLGLLLQEIPYLGKKKILKIFTPEHGLISLFAKKTTLSPFVLAEWIFKKTQNEMHPLEDTTLIDPFLHLRSEYKILSAAGSIAQDLLRTQLPDKRASELFELSLFFFKKLPLCPEIIAASFRLKLLIHEGLLSQEPDPLFTTLEWEQVHTLAFSRSLPVMQTITHIPYSKIKLLFDERFL